MDQNKKMIIEFVQQAIKYKKDKPKGISEDHQKKINNTHNRIFEFAKSTYRETLIKYKQEGCEESKTLLDEMKDL